MYCNRVMAEVFCVRVHMNAAPLKRFSVPSAEWRDYGLSAFT